MPVSDGALVGSVLEWVRAPDWEASRVLLEANLGELLTDAAEAALEHLIDVNPYASTLYEHLALLRAARAHGVADAYVAHEEQRVAEYAIDLLNAWIGTPTWNDSQAFAEQHEDELTSDQVAGALEAALAQGPDASDLRLHLGLLGLARSDGVPAAFAMLHGAPARRDALTSPAPDADPVRLLALARLDSGLDPDDPEAHFRLVAIALRLGDQTEAEAAFRACAQHSAPYELADFRRRLGRLAADHPDIAPAVETLTAVGTGDPPAATAG